MVSILPLIYNLSRSSSRVLRTIQGASKTDPHIPLPFQFSVKIQGFVEIFVFFYFHSVVHLNGKIHKMVNSLSLSLSLPLSPSIYLSIYLQLILGLFFWFGGPVCISKSKSILLISFSKTDSALWIYRSVPRPNFNFLHNFQSRLTFYFFCSCLLHPLIMWLTVSYFST